jgi:hypothetical protein
LKWRRIFAIALLAEAATLAVEFGLPFRQHRIFADPQFPNLIVFLHTPPSCIVTFRGSFYTYGVTSLIFWLVAVTGSTIAIRFLRRRPESN